jgi:hypothetical protein
MIADDIFRLLKSAESFNINDGIECVWILEDQIRTKVRRYKQVNKVND